MLLMSTALDDPRRALSADDELIILAVLLSLPDIDPGGPGSALLAAHYYRHVAIRCSVLHKKTMAPEGATGLEDG